MPLRFVKLAIITGYCRGLGAGTATTLPNILHVLADDLGWAEVGFHRTTGNSAGAADVRTPNLDRLAMKEGLRLERFYVHKICSPTRCSLQVLPLVVQDCKYDSFLSTSYIIRGSTTDTLFPADWEGSHTRERAERAA
jgi:hypothetical protein